MFGKVDVTTDIVYSQDIQQLETKSHMSWLPQEKLTTEEKETVQDYQRRKTALLGKYNTHIKDIERSHEAWIGNFTAQHKKRLQACQELYATEEKKVDKTVYSTDELQAYAIYQPALDTYKETKDRATIKYNKELEALELEFDKVAKEINKKIKERSEKKEEEEREQELQKLKEVVKGIAYDIKRVDKAIEEEDRYIGKPEVLALDKALARRYQHKLARHRRVLENRLHRRKEIIKGEGLSLDVAPDEELSDGGYSSIEEFQDKETLPQRHRIKRSRIREPYPSLYEYPHQIPTHHTVDDLPADELQELDKRIEVKAKQEKRKKGKATKKAKPDISEKGEPQLQIPVVEPQEVDRNIQPETPPQTPTMPRGDRRNNRDDDDDGGQNRNHYWSLRDIPKFEGKGEQPYSHLMEFEDYLVASGIAIEPDDEPDYRDIINKFKASLKNNARVWYSMYIENRVPDLHSAEGWKTVKSKFLTYFNPIGSTKEQQIKAWKELKWKPEEEKLTDFVFRFSQLAHELGYTEGQQISHFVLCIPRGLYLYLEGAQTVPDAVENLRKGIALGGLDTFGAIARPMQDDSKPTVPFMMMKENKTQEETLRVVKESIHDSMYESSKTLVKQLDKIGDKLTNVVEDFQKKQQTKSGRDRDRNRSNSRDRNNSGDRYRNRSWDRRDNRDRYRNRSGDRRDSRDNSRDRGRGRDRSNSREGRRNQPRSGSGQRYFDRNDFCNYCNRTGHATHRCFRLENYLKRKGKRIVLHDDDDVQEIAQAVQDLNTKLNSLKVGNSTNN